MTHSNLLYIFLVAPKFRGLWVGDNEHVSLVAGEVVVNRSWQGGALAHSELVLHRGVRLLAAVVELRLLRVAVLAGDQIRGLALHILEVQVGLVVEGGQAKVESIVSPGAHLHVAGVVLGVLRAGQLDVNGRDVEHKAT